MTDLRAIAEAARDALAGPAFAPGWLETAQAFQAEWNRPDRALAALAVIEAAREVAGFDAAFNADGSDRWPALRAALARWEALA